MEWKDFDGYKKALCIGIFIFMTGLYMLLFSYRYKNQEYDWLQDKNPVTQARLYYELEQYDRLEECIDKYKNYFTQDEINMYRQIIVINNDYERYCNYRDEILNKGLENMDKNHIKYFTQAAYMVLTPWNLKYNDLHEENRLKIIRYQDEVEAFIVYSMDELNITENELTEYIVREHIETVEDKDEYDFVDFILGRWVEMYEE